MAGDLTATRRSRPWGRFSYLDAGVSWLLGVALVCSSIPHLGNPYFFLGSVYSYRLLGSGVGQTVAMTLPFVEVVVAACLIANLFRGGAHVIALAMLAAFVAVQTSAKLRGLGIPCGCFGPRHGTQVGWFTLSVVYGLLLLAVARLFGYWCLARRTEETRPGGED